jgi:hypothetical protein
MPRMHALELLPDEAGCELVRRQWQALRDAGLPSQLDHRGATNSPHVTVLAAPAVRPDDEQHARDLVAPLLPVQVRPAGIALLGGNRVSLVRLVDVPDELVRAVLAHITRARRLSRDDVPAALDVVGHEDAVLTLATLRRWDPEAGIVTTL